MNRSQWRIVGLVLGMALAIAAFLVPGPLLDRTAALIGLDRLGNFAQPPLGMTARAALAAAALLAGLLLGWLLGRLFGSSRDRTRDEEDDFIPETRAASPAPDMTGWRTPAPAPPLPTVEERPVTVRTVPLGAPTEHISQSIKPSPIEPRPIEPSPADMPPDPAMIAPSPSVAAFDPRAHLPAAPVKAEAAADPAPALARLEAAMADLARYGPSAVTARFDTIDARLQQMAQQLAEIAALARAAARTPMTTSSPTKPDVRAVSTPTDPDRRRSVAETARSLRERLGEPAGLD